MINISNLFTSTNIFTKEVQKTNKITPQTNNAYEVQINKNLRSDYSSQIKQSFEKLQLAEEIKEKVNKNQITRQDLYNKDEIMQAILEDNILNKKNNDTLKYLDEYKVKVVEIQKNAFELEDIKEIDSQKGSLIESQANTNSDSVVALLS